MTPEQRARKLIEELWAAPWIGRSLTYPQGFPKDAEAIIAKAIRDAAEDGRE